MEGWFKTRSSSGAPGRIGKPAGKYRPGVLPTRRRRWWRPTQMRWRRTIEFLRRRPTQDGSRLAAGPKKLPLLTGWPPARRRHGFLQGSAACAAGRPGPAGAAGRIRNHERRVGPSRDSRRRLGGRRRGRLQKECQQSDSEKERSEGHVVFLTEGCRHQRLSSRKVESNGIKPHHFDVFAAIAEPGRVAACRCRPSVASESPTAETSGTRFGGAGLLAENGTPFVCLARICRRPFSRKGPFAARFGRKGLARVRPSSRSATPKCLRIKPFLNDL